MTRRSPRTTPRVPAKPTQEGDVPLRYSNPNGDGTKPFLTKLVEEKPENTLEYATLYTGMSLPVVPNVNGQKRPSVGNWTTLGCSRMNFLATSATNKTLGCSLGSLPTG